MVAKFAVSGLTESMPVFFCCPQMPLYHPSDVMPAAVWRIFQTLPSEAQQLSDSDRRVLRDALHAEVRNAAQMYANCIGVPEVQRAPLVAYLASIADLPARRQTLLFATNALPGSVQLAKFARFLRTRPALSPPAPHRMSRGRSPRHRMSCIYFSSRVVLLFIVACRAFVSL